MKPLPFREVKRKLEAAGFSLAGQTGSHIKFVKITASGAPQLFRNIARLPPEPFEASCDRQGLIRMSSTHCETMIEDCLARIAKLP
jgi:HicA-like toxin of HicAB toxin-antitoxin system